MESDNRLIIYKASAGTGKTYTLVLEYLKLLIRRPVNYKNILAITFTNAATLEMKTRIIEALESLSAEENEELCNQIIRELQEQEDVEFTTLEIKNNASKALSNILNDYSRFEISTIDAFFNRLVRSMARELKLPMRYEIELETDKALNYAIRQLYEMEEGQEQKIWNWLQDFAISRIEDDKGWKIDPEILKIGKKVFDEKLEILTPDPGMFDKLVSLKEGCRRTIFEFHSQMSAFAQRALDLIDSRQIKLEWFKLGKNSVAKNFIKIQNRDYDRSIVTLGNIIEGSNSWYAQSSPYRDQIQSLAEDGLDEITTEMLNYYHENLSVYNTADLIERNIYAYALVNAIKVNLKKYRDEENAFFLSDNNAVIHHLLKNDDTPFIYEKTGSFYKHIFIDEFQDTSRFQWKNLLPLIINALSDDTESHRIFIVGDVKQSIYRWRGGDMQLLLEGVEKDLENYRSITQVKNMKFNYRSRKKVIEFTNQFFNYSSELIKEQLKDTPEIYRIEDVYGNLDQLPKKEEEGSVEVRFFLDQEEATWKEQVRTHMLIRIRECLQLGYEPGDLLILTSRNEEANELANFLIGEGMPVISQSSLLLNNVPVIQLVLNLLSFLDHKEDQIARVGSLYWCRKLEGGKMISDFEKVKTDLDYFLSQMPSEFSERVSKLSRLPVYELIEELAVLFNLDHKAGMFLRIFKEIALGYLSKGLNGIGDFLKWWYEEDRELEMNSSTHLDAIRVMTIHKSKGLEAPVVFIPYCDFRVRGYTENIIWTSNLREDLEPFHLLPITFKDQAQESAFREAYELENIEMYLDTLNKTYVSFTRARDRLFVFSEKFKKERPEDISSIGRLLWSFSSSQPTWNELKSTYITGDPNESVHPQEKEMEAEFQEHHVIGYQYLKKVTIRRDSKNYYQLIDSQVAENIRIGIKRHELLSRLKNRDSLAREASRMYNEGLLTSQESERLINEFLELFDKPDFSSWFDPEWEVFAERPIISQGKWYQPDRVICKEGEAIIIDYKKEVHAQKHLDQVNGYEQLLKDIGYKVSGKYLVYLDQFEIMEVQ